MPIQICPAPPPLFRRIGLAMVLGADGADGRHPITRCMVSSWASACRLLVKRHRERRKRMRSR
nr:IncF plasmid conjugative transfer pilus assembly protein TraU [Escherichia coli]